MKLHFENVLTAAFFIVSIMVLAPACSKVGGVGNAPGTPGGVVEINPAQH